MTATTTHPQYAVGTWKLDPTHSEITFSVRHLAISKVRGSFRTFDVTVETTAEGQVTVEATVDIASVDTNQKDRDNHLRTSDFFLVEEYPTMTFRGSDIAIDGDDFTLAGELTLRGVTKPVTLRGEFGGIVTDGYGQTKAGVTASTKINRKDFGVNWNAALEGGGFTLGDDVTVNVEIQLVLQ
ncbi:YceI family protein [Galbitalea soli]|uniref:YceI family protein n=1 Tax=Galbitalea soli TaxID=1268042 RepID=A0A7C9PM05_9MICO|nr:YceI family protein [Galbitalea soli]NEM90447.1 YceI family protein [Galbitalea soli]NYJ31159.1 polyisoprenoid-binding protein YceI [Galbitalea soli]